MKIYFAGSIRGGRDDKLVYAEMIQYLSNFGEVLTEHIGDQTLSAIGEDGPNDKYIYDRDIAWLHDADVVVGEVSTPSLGVGYEIAKAEEWGKKILCIFRKSPERRLSAMIGGSDKIINRSYTTFDEVKLILDDFFKSV
jgi:hypothetical protein